jgi:hypothetical protein
MGLIYDLAVQEDLNIGTEFPVEVTNPDGGVLYGTQIGIHTVAVGQTAYATTWNPSAIAALDYEALSIAVPGAAIGDFVDVSLSSILTNDMQLTGHVSAADTVRVILFNPTSGSINLASGDLTVLVYKARNEA